MNTKSLIIVGVLVVVLVGVVAAVVITGDEDEAEEPILSTVYGNADGDFDIDSDDVGIIAKLADEGASASKNKEADVNCDGTIDSVDVELAKGLVDGSVKEIKVMDDSGNVKTVPYPYTDLLVTGGTNMRVAINVLQMEDDILANYTNKYAGEVLDKKLLELTKAGTITKVSSKATADDIAILSKLDLKGAVIEDEGMGEYGNETATAFFNEKGIQPLNFTMDNAPNSMAAIKALGILLGAEDRAQKYVDYLQGVIDTIDEKLGDKKGTATVMTVVMTNSVSGTSSDYFAMSELAGGNNIADFEKPTEKYDPNSGNYWLLDPKYNPDYLIHIKSIAYGKDITSKDVEKYKGYFDQTKAYENGNYYLINGTLPLPVRLAYMSEIMYPDVYGPGWADGVFQQYMDDFGQVPGWDVTEHKAIWSVADF